MHAVWQTYSNAAKRLKGDLEGAERNYLASLDWARHQQAKSCSYTPTHLAEKILTSRSVLEGERKQVTVLFADLKGSMELLAARDPEEARKILDPVLERMMEAAHRFVEVKSVGPIPVKDLPAPPGWNGSRLRVGLNSVEVVVAGPGDRGQPALRGQVGDAAGMDQGQGIHQHAAAARPPGTGVAPPAGRASEPARRRSSDDLVRSQEDRRRDREAERLRGFEVDDEFELRRLFYRELGWSRRTMGAPREPSQVR